jgi:hypothetical protein
MRLAVVACLVACSSTAPPPREPTRLASSPGPLATSHAAIDNQLGCNDCHAGASIVAAKCLACHDAVRDRIAERAGMHGRFEGRACETCHAEHRGRAFDLRGWGSLAGGEAGFDHALAGWALRGKHATIACERCHPTTNTQGLRRYLGADRACVACHADGEPHRTTIACDRCHRDDAWLPVKQRLEFEHPKRFALRAAHAAVGCKKCHTDGTFPMTAVECGSCHASPHGADIFSVFRCSECHSDDATTLKYVAFDHGVRTGLALGPHRQHACTDCHGTPPAAATCAQCHTGVQPVGRKVTRHRTRFAGRTCQSCHTLASWTSLGRFDHAKTRFPLRDHHARIACRACHRGTDPAMFEDLRTQSACADCHAHAKVHDGKYTRDQCVKCHVN